LNAALQPRPLPIGFYEARAKLAASLMGVKAVLTAESDHPFVVARGAERGFKLKLHESNPDAPLSPIFLNLRTPENPKPGTLTPEIVARAATCMIYMRGNAQTYQAVVGVPRAGDPFAEAFARLTHVPRLEMDKLEEGGKRHIAGVKGRTDVADSVQQVLVIDDLLTKADSKIEAIDSLEKSGFKVTDVMVLVDREQGGGEELAKRGVTLHAVFTLTELLDTYVDSGDLTSYMKGKVLQYLLENS
jgi:orotate phosphoribosyltransferase